MGLYSRLSYYRRSLGAYLSPGHSHLSFWQEAPRLNLTAPTQTLGEYYMGFESKADFALHRDDRGIPMLDYRGKIGLQYNPIAISQWGLGNYNLYSRTSDPQRRTNFLAAADWLCKNLTQNRFGLWVWQHNFDWEYRDRLRAPWYSGLAQGQGISLLVRAHKETERPEYGHAAQRAFASFLMQVGDGGVTFSDENGDLWFEEYIVSPPTHILNGFIWAAWGVHDYFLATGDPTPRSLFEHAAQTLLKNLPRYDAGFWSLYEQSGTRLPMLASSFYHRLHIVQLRVMERLTGETEFKHMADRWEEYSRSRFKRMKALCYKSVFKLCYY
jgi:heparosan-N-sulfate-glucuronate 5-epimerase